ncbi:MAG: hypothetical protein EHM13_09835, partial [Acidobacteria bacterium]
APASASVRPQVPPPANAAAGSTGFVPLTVLAVRDETPTIRTFRVERPKDFAFEAGQFLTVRVQVDNKPLVRCYSLSSAPETPGYLEISVRRQGVVSGALHATLRQGSTLWARWPAGRFVYPEGDDRPLVLIAGGVGITPLMSMLRHSVAARPHRPVTLLYSARTASDIAYRAELTAIASVHPQARVLVTVTEESVAPPLLNGRICRAFLQAHITSPLDSVFCLCGPGVMIDDTARDLEGLGVPGPQVRREVFQAATAIGAIADAGVASPASPVASPAFTLSLARSNRTVEMPAGATLLEAAESAGATIPTICRSGVCTTCRTRVASGHVRCTSDALPEADREAGFVLPCVSFPLSDVALEA